MRDAPPHSSGPQAPLNGLSASDATALRIYAGYRIILALTLLLAFGASAERHLLGAHAPVIYLGTGGLYLLYALIAALLIPRHRPIGQPRVFTLFFLDLLALSLMTHASGGIGSGLGLLMLVAVAAASAVLRGQVALLTAALASLAILAGTLHLIAIGLLTHAALLPAGLLGALFFATSLFVQTLSRRVRSTQQLAQARAADVDKLLHLNQLIVQRMRTGVLVVTADSRIRTLNQSAAELLGLNIDPTAINAEPPLPLPAHLAEHLRHWRDEPRYQGPPFNTRSDGPEVLARFTSVDGESVNGKGDTVVFLEDHGRLAQRAQQLKLAALGRLTASIAHEIRNPLGAISHAAQLLGESEDIGGPDRRLADIIQTHSQRINRIVENVLQLSRRRAPEPQRLQLARWLSDFAAEFLRDLGEAADIQIEIEQPVAISFDSDQLRQVLINLLENALRYSRHNSRHNSRHDSRQAQGQAQALLRIGQDHASSLPILDIIDFGPGIADSEREKVFEPFYTTEAQGNGLGLFISRELCEINMARLNYLRDRDGRSCFRISFSHPDRRPLSDEWTPQEAPQPS